MPINPPVSSNFTSADRRAAHGAGESIYTYVKDVGAELPTIYPPRENLNQVASFTTTASVVYARYLGRATGAKPLNTINVTTSGTASVAVTSTVGFATSATGPAGAGLVLTPQAVGTITTTGSAGVKSSAALAYVPPAGSHVWVFHHVSTGTTQPTLWALGGEIGLGLLQSKTSQVAAPVVGTAITFALITPAVTAQVPSLFLS